MHNIRIIENILIDLKKIEQALKIESIDTVIINRFSLIIIEIYQECIMKNKDGIFINANTLSDVYILVMQYYNCTNESKINLIDDIISRMQKII